MTWYSFFFRRLKVQNCILFLSIAYLKRVHLVFLCLQLSGFLYKTGRKWWYYVGCKNWHHFCDCVLSTEHWWPGCTLLHKKRMLCRNTINHRTYRESNQVLSSPTIRHTYMLPSLLSFLAWIFIQNSLTPQNERLISYHIRPGKVFFLRNMLLEHHSQCFLFSPETLLYSPRCLDSLVAIGARTLKNGS